MVLPIIISALAALTAYELGFITAVEKNYLYPEKHVLQYHCSAGNPFVYDKKRVTINNNVFEDSQMYPYIFFLQNQQKNGAACYRRANHPNCRDDMQANVRICANRRRRYEDFTENFPLANMDELRQGFDALVRDPTRDIHYIDVLPTPFTRVVVRGAQVQLPLFLEATIRYSNLPSGGRQNIPTAVYRHLQNNMNAQSGDDAGHLLAYSLGGGMTNLFNYAPQTNRLNRNIGGDAIWRAVETDIHQFLVANPQTGRAEWRMAVIYGADNDRPIGFIVNYELYNNNVRTFARTWSFNNDPVGECLFDLHIRYRQDCNDTGFRS